MSFMNGWLDAACIIHEMFRRRSLIRKETERFLELMTDFSTDNKLRIAAIMYNRVGNTYSAYEDCSHKIVDFAALAMTEAIESNLDYAKSQDLRYGLMMRKGMFAADEEIRKKYSIACAKGFNHCIEFINQGGTLHKNHIENLAASASLSKESVEILNNTVMKNPHQVAGLVSVARSLLMYGHIDGVMKVLPVSKITEIPFSFVRMDHHIGIDKHWDALIAKYSNPVHKAKVAALMVLPDFEMKQLDGSTTYFERIGKVLALAQKAKSDLSGDDQIESIVSNFRSNFSMKDMHLFDDFYAKNKSKRSWIY